MTKPVDAKHPGNKHNYKKKIVKGKVPRKGKGVFSVRKSGMHGARVFLDLGKSTKFRVVKLSLVGLPQRTNTGKKIKWINNFGIKRESGGYVGRVRYAVFLPYHKGQKFVYFADGALRYDKTPKPAKAKFLPRDRTWARVTLDFGDPAIGEG